MTSPNPELTMRSADDETLHASVPVRPVTPMLDSCFCTEVLMLSASDHCAFFAPSPWLCIVGGLCYPSLTTNAQQAHAGFAAGVDTLGPAQMCHGTTEGFFQRRIAFRLSECVLRSVESLLIRYRDAEY